MPKKHTHGGRRTPQPGRPKQYVRPRVAWLIWIDSELAAAVDERCRARQQKRPEVVETALRKLLRLKT